MKEKIIINKSEKKEKNITEILIFNFFIGKIIVILREDSNKVKFISFFLCVCLFKKQISSEFLAEVKKHGFNDNINALNMYVQSNYSIAPLLRQSKHMGCINAEE
ncbi:hypothetical protein RFI_03090 [Reticulomyxa filosa]|uniref:Uncharacterized protein n=1 Tax=Reticulomyxa filosa TaxID=46433 RepID=X6P8M3_RETFI|nr:hypothetical protein RFI_03090 [Reticulomyxa filosa]|eukprot:ETO34002.1 hypothetical protein RFI_03090 [Reticulomyxa filosa]